MPNPPISEAAQRLLARVADAYPKPFKTSARGRAAAKELAQAGLLAWNADVCTLNTDGVKHLGLTPVAPPAGPRPGSKAALVIAMLEREAGATVAQISEATEWLPHSVRGFFAGALKKKHGLAVASEMVEGVRVYRLAGE